jgi:hypothetical protein
MAADAMLVEIGVRQLAFRIPFDEHNDTDANLPPQSCEFVKIRSTVFTSAAALLKNRNNPTVDFKNLKSVVYLSLRLIYHLKG